jgi:hypothetical protein
MVTMPGSHLTDTSPEIERLQLELMRDAPVWRKLELVGQMFESMKVLALAGLRQRHPQAEEAELRRRLADLLLGPELAQRAYGPLTVKGDDHAA